METYSKKIGNKLKEKRLQKNLSLQEISKETRIRIEFLKKIENEEFSHNEDHVYNKGFIKIYAQFLGLDPTPLLAIYKRDFEITKSERKKSSENLHPSLGIKNKLQKIEITQKHFVILFVLITILLSTIAVLKLFTNTFEQPYIKIFTPIETQRNTSKEFNTQEKTIVINGETTKNTKIFVNDSQVVLKPGNAFESDPIPLLEEKNIIEIKAVNLLGIESKIILYINTLSEEKNISEPETKELFIVSKNRDQFVRVVADDIIKFEEVMYPNNAYSFEVKKTIEIHTDYPQDTVIVYDNVEYILDNIISRFNFENGKLLR